MAALPPVNNLPAREAFTKTALAEFCFLWSPEFIYCIAAPALSIYFIYSVCYCPLVFVLRKQSE